MSNEIVRPGWLCRSCSCIEREPYRYPPSPWAYCSRCDGALMPDEQIAAVARLRLEGQLPDVTAVVGLPKKPPDSVAQTAKTAPLITIRDVATLLCTTEAAVYALKARRRLPGVVKVGRRVLFRRDALLRWLAEGEPHR